jgi:flagellar hook protein FlgE
MNISNNVSSISAHQTMMNNSAQNVANVNTDGYIPKNTIINNNGSSVSANTRESTDTNYAKSQTNLTKEMTDQISIEKTTALNVTAIKTQDEMIGSVLDMKA